MSGLLARNLRATGEVDWLESSVVVAHSGCHSPRQRMALKLELDEMMNLQETVFSIFPGCTLTGAVSDDGIYEIGGITGAMVPQNCEVLASGVFQYSISERSRRTYLVMANKRVLMVRILPDASNHLCAQIMERAAREVPGTKCLH